MSNALLTDLYELTMLEAYRAEGMSGCAVFELFVRKLPAGRNFLVAAGLAQLLAWLSALRFDEHDLAWLRASTRLSHGFVDSLRDFRFEGDVDAMPEGTPFFADEPIVRVTAPIGQAQLVESRLMNLVHFETVVASKAVRCALAAPGRQLIDFGLRRAHGEEAALLSARASYLAGFTATATVAAAQRFGIPAAGTMAHSYIQTHASEREAFAAFARVFPDNAVLLIDTYDTLRAAQTVVGLAPELAAEGIAIKGVRIDSGDLGELARGVREAFDANECDKLTIFASGNLDEYRLHELVASGAPIDGFGVGTRMNTSVDAPYLDCAYKLVEYDGRPRRKRSSGKVSWPGRKQVWRRFDRQGIALGDVVALDGETVDGAPLLVPVMRGGRTLEPQPTLAQSRARLAEGIAALPPALHRIDQGAPYEVEIVASIRALAARVDRAG